ncbi:MAG: hypothetical protein V5A16_06930, partial [Haloplanus sp.]
VLMPGNRTWLSSIGPSQRLVVETPSGYQVTDTRFGLDNGSVVVEGPHTFRDPLTISYQQTATTTQGPEPPSTPWSLIAGALLAGLALVAAAGYLHWRDGDRQPSASDTSADAGAEPPDSGPGDAGADATGMSAASTGGDAAGEAEDDGTDGTAADTAADEPSEEEEIDPALLSDEERVEHLLDRNGGRMKQARIVKETGWSDAKVSQLLSTMADEERIEKLRLGRENLISLPDEEP